MTPSVAVAARTISRTRVDVGVALGERCGRGPEYYTGNDHIVIVETEDMFHVTFGETYKVLGVPDDPTLPTHDGHGTDAFHFNFTKSGTEVRTESFHDFRTDEFGTVQRIDYHLTFVFANGELRVDREIIRNFPPFCPE